ncbi:MAG: type III-B CRISPR-associated protein Cas10/Cmr2 [Geminicoccaceae bacterium]|nr:type III-B CRISPR-associated protein Cas10/Cmr2 [Geminicoccaceae bacterium]
MSAHLLQIALGPVQDFVAQARRTRDLWFGSHLLCELARAGAKALAEAGALSILPALDRGDPELEPCDGFLRDNGKPPAPIANKLLARLPEGLDPAETARATRAAIFHRWEAIAERVRARCRGLIAEDADRVWKEQIATAIEFYASWAPLDGDYAETRKKLDRAIAARKMLREFGQWKHDRARAPKSSLDGGRVSVLAEVRPTSLVRDYRIGRGEQLDAVGLVKRAGGEPEQFPSILNIALAAWIDVAARHAAGELARLCERARELRLPRVSRPDLAWASAFPFTAEALVASRVPPLFAELDIAGDPEAFVRHELRPLYRVVGEPSPDVACRVADGDRMGKTLDAIGDPGAHRTFSKALAGFAAEVRTIVEQDHRGSLVYAGGDDVLAVLPVVDAVRCAEALRRRFEQVGGAAAPAGTREVERPTVSVGSGLGHDMDGLGALLELGRAAARLAKTRRNALAVILDKRSGGRRQWLGRWPSDPAGRLKEDARLVAEELSTKKIHEIATILRRLPEPARVAAIESEIESESWRRVLEGEVRRALFRNEPKPLTLDDVHLELSEDYTNAHEAVARWVDRLLIARAIAEAEPRPKPRPQPSEKTVEEPA